MFVGLSRAQSEICRVGVGGAGRVGKKGLGGGEAREVERGRWSGLGLNLARPFWVVWCNGCWGFRDCC